MALFGLCSTCGSKVPIGKSCAKCNKERYKQYKHYRKDKQEQAFYRSKEWIELSFLVKQKQLNLCLYCLNRDNIKNCDVTHHIIELKEDWNKRLDKNNLISLCNRCHTTVHKEYKKNKSAMQKELIGILEAFKKQYNY